MGADPDGRPVRRLLHVRKWVAVFKESRQELVDEMRMRTAVTAALDERQVTFVGDAPRELTNGRGQTIGVIRDLDAFRDLRLGPLCGVEHRILVGDELPLERLLRTVDVYALAILSRGVPEKTPDVGGEVRVLILMWHDSTANREPERLAHSSLIVPEPKQLT